MAYTAKVLVKKLNVSVYDLQRYQLVVSWFYSHAEVEAGVPVTANR